jgi:hypothetical protein
MNVRLKKQFYFHCGVVYKEQWSINEYTLSIDMLTASEDPHEQNIAYERIKYWISEVLAHSTLISYNSKLLEAYQKTGQRVLVLPDEPVDQIIGMMICLKLNAICENRIIITDIDVSSTEGENVIFKHTSGEMVGPFTEDSWWIDPRPCWADPKNKQRKGNVISLAKVPEWHELNLDWDEEGEEEETVVLLADFKKDGSE